MNVAEKQREKNAFLYMLYERSVEGTFRFENMYDLGNTLGFDASTTKEVVHSLNYENLLIMDTNKGVKITYEGIVRAENLIRG